MVTRKKTTRGKKAQAVKASKAAAPKKARATAKAKAKTTAKKAATSVATAMQSNKPISQKQTKSQIYAELAGLANVSKGDAKNVVNAMLNLIERHVKPKGSGIFTLPDLGIRVRRIHKKASKARMGRNPFTGEQIQIPAKPARKSVKVSALRALKSLIEE